MNAMTRQRQRGVTIRAVAERAGVSAMTVSNVINGAGRTSAATIETVRAAITELGYVPNLAARRLAKARATTVGLIYSDRRTPFLDAVLVGSLRATNAHGLQLILRDADDCVATGAEQIAQDLVRSGADALLLVPPFAEHLSGSGMPGTVRVDNHAAMLSITERVIINGHRRIAYVAGPDPYSVVAARLSGFRAALQHHGLTEDDRLIVQHGGFDHVAGTAAARSLLTMAQPPSAIICSSDDLAAGVMAEAHHIGLLLPRDLTVTGFDDTILASRLFPALTVVRQPVEDMAFRATQCLIAALGKGPDLMQVSDEIFDHAIVERQSVAPPGWDHRRTSHISRGMTR
jgi:LacI family transcriptional regulator